MKNDSEENSLTTEDLAKMYEGLQKDYSNAVKLAEKEKTSKILWMIVASFFVYTWLYGAKHHIIWVPDPNDPRMRVDYQDWWGIEKHTFWPIWRKPTGEEGWDSAQWCIKYPDGTWQVFLKDDLDGVHYEWPEKGYIPQQKK